MKNLFSDWDEGKEFALFMPFKIGGRKVKYDFKFRFDKVIMTTREAG